MVFDTEVSGAVRGTFVVIGSSDEIIQSSMFPLRLFHTILFYVSRFLFPVILSDWAISDWWSIVLPSTWQRRLLQLPLLVDRLLRYSAAMHLSLVLLNVAPVWFLDGSICVRPLMALVCVALCRRLASEFDADQTSGHWHGRWFAACSNPLVDRWSGYILSIGSALMAFNFVVASLYSSVQQVGREIFLMFQ
jgi:hypothetical protein